MNLGQACAIIAKIDIGEYTEEEIITAIYYVMNMDTHNGVTKEKLVNVIKWLWYKNYMFVPVPAQQRN